MAAAKQLAQQFALVLPPVKRLRKETGQARDPGLSQEAQTRLYAKRSLRRELAQNPNLSYELLLALVEEHPQEILENPAFSLFCLERPELLLEVSRRFIQICRCRALSGERLHWLVENAFPNRLDAAEVVCSHPNTRAETLQRVFDEGFDVVEMLQHKNVPAEILRLYMLDDTASYREVAAKNPNAPAELLTQLRRAGFSLWLERSPAPFGLLPEGAYAPLIQESKYLAELIAKSPLTPEAIVRSLSSHEELWVRVGAAQNTMLPVECAELLLRDREATVRAMLARNLTTPARLLCQAARDLSPEVRLAVARHRYAPKEALRLLSRDKEGAVRDAAMSHSGFQRL